MHIRYDKKDIDRLTKSSSRFFEYEKNVMSDGTLF
jgi:hypothetical protein